MSNSLDKENLILKSRDFGNCRVKAVQDALLLNGISIDIHWLHLMSMKTFMTLAMITYKNEMLPVLSPCYYEGDISVLKCLGVDYTDVGECKHLEEYVKKNIPVIAYYSADALAVGKNYDKVKFCSVSSMVLYEEKEEMLHTTIAFDKKYEWISSETLRNVRFSPIIPLPPEGRAIILDTSKIKKRLQDDEYIFEKAYGSFTELVSHGLDAIEYKTFENCKLGFGLNAILEFRKKLQEFRNRLLFETDELKAGRLFRVWLRIFKRFLMAGDDSCTLFRGVFIESVCHIFEKERIVYEEYYGNIVCTKWKKIVNLLQKLDNMHREFTRELLQNNINAILVQLQDIYYAEKHYIEYLQKAIVFRNPNESA